MNYKQTKNHKGHFMKEKKVFVSISAHAAYRHYTAIIFGKFH